MPRTAWTGLGLLLLVPVGWALVDKDTRRVKPPVEHLYFKCRLLVNPASRATLADAVIETNGGTILRVDAASVFALPSDARVIDFRDHYIIPGLVDTHGHLYARTHLKSRWQKADRRLPLFYLAAGVTAVGNPGSMDASGDVALRNQIDAGELPGPRFFLAGEYIDMPPNLVGWMEPVTTPQEARAKVRKWAGQGVAAVKIYSSAHGDVLRAAIEEAHEHSLRVWAHVGAVTFQQAIVVGGYIMYSCSPCTKRRRATGRYRSRISPRGRDRVGSRAQRYGVPMPDRRFAGFSACGWRPENSVYSGPSHAEGPLVTIERAVVVRSRPLNRRSRSAPCRVKIALGMLDQSFP
jgi:hypothetical protein